MVQSAHANANIPVESPTCETLREAGGNTAANPMDEPLSEVPATTAAIPAPHSCSVLALSLGVETEGGEMEVFVARNAVLPASCTKELSVAKLPNYEIKVSI